MPRRRSIQDIPKIKNIDLVEYVIYARKSTEDDEKQKESIPQQLEQCFRFAENSGLLLKPRPADFSPDEELIQQINEAFVGDSEKRDSIRNKYIEYFVVGEVKSAKTPGKREKWMMLISLAKIGQINGLLGYAPDRFARNLQEGGEVIQLADDRTVDLKFTSFAFENNASGHMMLGIFFVFAEHYSKKLSEDSLRGTKQKSLEGKRCGARKIGYIADDEDYFVPHYKNFPLLQKAFKRKIYDEWSDEMIAEELNSLSSQKRSFFCFKKSWWSETGSPEKEEGQSEQNDLIV